MKTTIKRTFNIAIVALFLSSCSSSTPEDACNCIKQTANDYMIQGIKPSKSDLKASCQELIDKFNDDGASRALIESCGADVLAKVEKKELFEINGVIPNYPTHIFKSMLEAQAAINAKNGKYKYLKTNVEINEVFISKLTKINNEIFDNDSKKDNSYIIGGYSEKINDFHDVMGLKISADIVDESAYKNSITFSPKLTWDIKDQVYVDGIFNKNSDNYKYIREVITENFTVSYSSGLVKEYDVNFVSDPYAYEELISEDRWFSNRVNHIVKQPGLENFIEDMKNGRFKVITSDDYKQLSDDKNDNICLTSANVKGVFYDSNKGLAIEVSEISNITKLETPSIFSASGKKIDFSKYIK